MTNLAEALGYAASDKLVIISVAGLGSLHSTNVGSYQALREGCAQSATLMTPCPWARQAAKTYRGEDVGVCLTLNSPFEAYKWGPITQAPSLLGGEGGFPRTRDDLWDHADPDETRRELRAQIERAVIWGFDVSHLSSHMSTLLLRPEFFGELLDLAVEFELPLRPATEELQRGLGFPLRELCADESVLCVDHVVEIRESEQPIDTILENLSPGVTDLVFFPAVETEELKAIDPEWNQRVNDLKWLVGKGHEALERHSIRRIDYRSVRAAMRALKR